MCKSGVLYVGRRTQFYLVRSFQFDLQRNSGVSELILLICGHTTDSLFLCLNSPSLTSQIVSKGVSVETQGTCENNAESS